MGKRRRRIPRSGYGEGYASRTHPERKLNPSQSPGDPHRYPSAASFTPRANADTSGHEPPARPR